MGSGLSTEACYQQVEVSSGEVQEVDQSMILFGILLGCLGSVGINTGNNMQAVGLKMSDATGQTHNLTWMIGTLIFFTATIINFVAFGFAPAAVLAPLESIQFVCNVIFNRVINKARVTPLMYAGSFCVVAGTLVAVVWGPRNVYSFDLGHLKCFWAAPGWLLYLFLVIVVAASAEKINRVYQRAHDAGEPLQNDSWAKVISELFELLTAKEQTSILSDWFFWFTLVLFAVTGFVWLYRLNKALKLYSPLFIIPLLQSNYIMCAVVSGGIYFQEFLEMKAHQWVLFILGIALMFYGLYLLFPRKDKGDDFPKEAAVSVAQTAL